MSLRLARPLIALGIATCVAPQTAAAGARTASPSPTISARSPETLPAGAMRFTITPSRSQATIRVREQVAGIPAPGEAVLTAKAFSGSLVLLADGSFAPGSVIAVDLDTLSSDSELRDEWIKVNTLQTRVYPRAEFSPHGSWTLRSLFPPAASGRRRSKES